MSTTEYIEVLDLDGDVEIVEVSPGTGPRGLKGDKGDIGDPGPPALAATYISADASNRLIVGSDARLFVQDDLTPDPLAYYILAKS